MKAALIKECDRPDQFVIEAIAPRQPVRFAEVLDTVTKRKAKRDLVRVMG